jgi:hypothetical protein
VLLFPLGPLPPSLILDTGLGYLLR